MNDGETMSQRGAALRDAEDYDAAIAVLRRAVAAGESQAPRLLALSLIEVNDREGARDVLVQAVDAGRTDLAGLLGDVADDLDDPTLAERSYRLAVDSGDVDALNDFGVFLSGQERYEEAIAVLRRATESGDELAPANLVLIYLEDLNDIATAKSLGEQYFDESKPKTFTALASVYAESGALDQAEAMYRRAIDLGAPRAHLNPGPRRCDRVSVMSVYRGRAAPLRRMAPVNSRARLLMIFQVSTPKDRLRSRARVHSIADQSCP